MRRFTLQALIFVFALFGISTSVAFAANDVESPYGLELHAWKGNGITEVTVHAYALDGTSAPPSAITSLKIKAFNEADKHLFTQEYDESANLTNLTTVQLQTDKKNRAVDSIEVVVIVPGDKKKPKKYKLEGSTTVLLRPDLAVTNASAPSTVKADEPFQVTASLQELNGKSGATARVDLLNGDRILGTINEISIGKGETKPMIFTTTLHEPGVYPLSIRIVKTDVAQSNTSNDQADVTVRVEAAQAALPLPYFSAQYNYCPSFEMHYVGLQSGVMYYAYDYTNASDESFGFNTTVPGGLLQGGSVSVELRGTTTGQTYSFDIQNINWDPSQGFQYQNHDDAKGIFVDIMPNSDGDTISIMKNAGKYESSVYYDNVWHPFNYSAGESALREESSVEFTITITNNEGQTYVKSGTIVLEYAPTQFDDRWDWQNESNHSWGFNYHHQGVLSSFQ